MPTRGGEVVTAEGSTPMPSPSPTSSTSAGPHQDPRLLPLEEPTEKFCFYHPIPTQAAREKSACPPTAPGTQDLPN